APLPLVLPLGAPPGQLAPSLAWQVHASKTSPAGSASATTAIASCASSGATVDLAVLLTKLTVYSNVSPAVTVSASTVLVATRSTSSSTMVQTMASFAGAPQADVLPMA